ncbi:imidazole glycerol phosphate synthase subunit HisH [Paenibacillus sp. FSL A5-0031]|uniref:imidazole glycerol phosphate synthase subunit HisH n=1 Tax=Paenibacillus sp. FSL A5-0031 TaxID=1920420 RepID=UPI00096FAA8E|nr:imidazole glycerol phosphate synthase subunit HisH [Paenibacillus sp. FSL A5-0031]OME87126.1 imidazole glycerol phosphate synthase subunit HisH [Paenibacillus sp. FSL A5-0031]
MNRVTVVDYGSGNILSVKRALEFCGAVVEVTSNPQVLNQSERILLPGVGAFGSGMRALKNHGLVEALQGFSLSEKPLMGICLGMQLLFESSEEFGYNEGLGVIPGVVVPIPLRTMTGINHKVPHMGWNELRRGKETSTWKNTILEGTEEGSAVYFVHSFMARPRSEQVTLSFTQYNGWDIPAIVKLSNVYGCQFHPEKSGEIGLQILEQFIQLK